jgi:hypothetical protein
LKFGIANYLYPLVFLQFFLTSEDGSRRYYCHLSILLSDRLIGTRIAVLRFGVSQRCNLVFSKHNRCLRFDRIQSILPATGHWRSEGLDYLKVYLHFDKGMVKAYEPRVGQDISDETTGNVRQVVRQVNNPFWLVREVLRYGQDCIVISPDNVREAVKREIIATCRNYDIKLM